MKDGKFEVSDFSDCDDLTGILLDRTTLLSNMRKVNIGIKRSKIKKLDRKYDHFCIMPKPDPGPPELELGVPDRANQVSLKLSLPIFVKLVKYTLKMAKHGLIIGGKKKS